MYVERSATYRFPEPVQGGGLLAGVSSGGAENRGRHGGLTKMHRRKRYAQRKIKEREGL